MLRSTVTALLAFLASTDALSMTGVVTPTNQATALNGLLARRSVVKYDTAKPVPAEAVDRALNAAVRKTGSNAIALPLLSA